MKQKDKNKSMHYSSLQGHFPFSPSLGITWQHIWVVLVFLSLSITVIRVREPDSLLKHKSVAWQQIALFHGVLGTVRAWTRPACTVLHATATGNQTPNYGSASSGYFIPPFPLLSFIFPVGELPTQPLHPVMEKPPKPWTTCSWFSVQMFEWKFIPFPSLYLLLLIKQFQGPVMHMLEKCVPTVLYRTEITSFLMQRFYLITRF